MQRAAVAGVDQGPTRPQSDAAERGCRDPHQESGRLGEHAVDIAQQRPAPGHRDPGIEDVGGDLGLGMLQRDAYRLDDLRDRLVQRLRDLGLLEADFARHALAHVATAHQHRLANPVLGHPRGADLFLDPLGGGFADLEIVRAADVGHDRFVHLVPADAHRAAIHQSVERNYPDLGGAAADVRNHRAYRVGDGEVGADPRGHRFLDQPHFARPGIRGGVADRAALDPGRSRWDADDDLGLAADAPLAAVRLVDEMLEHMFGDIEVGDDPVAKRADRADRLRSLAHHQFGVAADRAHLWRAIAIFHRHHRRLVEDDALVAQIDDGVGGAEIDGDVTRREIEHSGKAHDGFLADDGRGIWDGQAKTIGAGLHPDQA